MSSEPHRAAEPGGAVAVSDLLLARMIAAAVQTVPGVSDVNTRVFAGPATYGPGGMVRGVAVHRDAGVLDLAVHVIARYAVDAVLPDVAADVRRSVRQAMADAGAGPVRRVDVVIDGLDIE